MSVLVVVRSEHDAQHLIPWSARFAAGDDQKLRVAVVDPGRGTFSWRGVPVVAEIEPTGGGESGSPPSEGRGEGPEQSLLVARVRAAIAAVRQQSLARNAASSSDSQPSQITKLLTPRIFYGRGDQVQEGLQSLIAEREPATVVVGWRDRARDSDVGSLITAVGCRVIVLRAGPAQDLSHPRLLVPVAGGPHAFNALRLAVAMRSPGDPPVTALHVSRDAETPDAEAVAAEHLEALLRRLSETERPQVRLLAVVDRDVRTAVEAAAADHDLVLLGASDSGAISRSLFGTIGDHLFAGDSPTSIAVVRRPDPLASRALRWLAQVVGARVPQLSREERIRLFDQLATGSECGRDYLLLIVLSTTLAALGLMQDSTAVVVGAMLVAPLMTPLIGAGLGLVQGNLLLVKTSARSIAMGFVLALATGYLLGILNPGLVMTPEINARGGPNLLDLLVAAASGIAAAYALCRPQLSAALPGVAIAAALIPPVASIGLALSLGELAVARGATLLFAVNVVVIILISALVLSLMGVRAGADARGRLWVRRVLVGLILSVGLLSVPLGGAFIAQFTAGDAWELSGWLPEQSHEIDALLGGEVQLMQQHRGADGVWEVDLQLTAPHAPSAEQLTATAAFMSNHLEAPVRLQVTTVLRAQVSAERGRLPSP